MTSTTYGGHDPATITGNYNRPPPRKEEDVVNHPKHYTHGGVETIDFILAKQLGFCLGNVVKYVSRAGVKTHNPLEDLKKARWYLNKEIERLEK
mgnify:CR=1 FL=1